MDRHRLQTMQTEMRAPQPMQHLLPAKVLPAPISAPQIQWHPVAPWQARHLRPHPRGGLTPCPGWTVSLCQPSLAQPQHLRRTATNAPLLIAFAAHPERLAGHFGLQLQAPLRVQILPGHLPQRAAPAHPFPACRDPVQESLGAWPCVAPHWHSTPVRQVQAPVMRALQVLPAAAVPPAREGHVQAQAHRAMEAPAPWAPQALALGGIPTNPDHPTTAVPAAHNPEPQQDRVQARVWQVPAQGRWSALAACHQKKACPAWAATVCAPCGQPPHRKPTLRALCLRQQQGQAH